MPMVLMKGILYSAGRLAGFGCAKIRQPPDSSFAGCCANFEKPAKPVEHKTPRNATENLPFGNNLAKNIHPMRKYSRSVHFRAIIAEKKPPPTPPRRGDAEKFGLSFNLCIYTQKAPRHQDELSFFFVSSSLRGIVLSVIGVICG
jgi:hypothetical protein